MSRFAIDMSKGSVYLKAKKDRPLRRGHLWVFSGAIKEIEGSPVHGDIVDVKAANGDILGSGHYQPDGSITVRILTRGEEKWTKDKFEERIATALRSRKESGLVSGSNNMFRLVHGEGDLLPGLIIDIFGSAAVIETHSMGMELNADLIADTLKSVLERKLETIYLKSKISGEGRFLKGDSNAGIGLENDISFKVDWVDGQKTGFFLDQRDNRELLGKYSSGKKVLNAYCYSGGFSMYALKAGADEVVSIDSSQSALDILNENIALNKFVGTHTSRCEDVMEYLKQLDTAFDVIILDPPAFAKHKRARHRAIQAYKRLNQLAIKKVAPGGKVFTFSCSQVVDNQLFKDTVVSAVLAESRTVRILHQLHQAPDHPVNPAHQESEYLKGLVLRVD